MATVGGETRAVALGVVAVGGALGTLLRYGLGVWVPGDSLLGTLAANVAASFLLGIVLTEARLAGRFRPETRLLVATGFCGSLSTYSTFAADVTSLAPAAAAGYVAMTYLSGAGGVISGQLLARWVG